ncbi:MAG: DegV family protein [Oscillospiraceae bacterium]|nr:DegV family protein [Oscillospiraceae bacterium]
MNHTAIITDTNSGITPDEARKLGIFAMPMPVLADAQTYYEGQDLTHEQLYAFMREDRDLSTSQPAIGDVLALWDQLLADGYQEILYIPMSSGLSGSCAAATGMAAEYDGKVQVADVHRISVTLRDAVLDAKSFADQGMTAAQIKEKIEENALNSVVYLGVDTLKYFKKNGRATAAAVAVATVLNLKPILITEGGKFDTFAKVRGIKACKDRIIDALKKELETRFQGVPHSELRLATASTLESAEDAEAWRRMVQEAFPEFEVTYDPLSCSIACHTGIGAVGAGLSRVQRNG